MAVAPGLLSAVHRIRQGALMPENGDQLELDMPDPEVADADMVDAEEIGPPLDDMPAVVRALLLGYDEA